jgi:D-3-phosphoglycerate dehydrogenase
VAELTIGLVLSLLRGIQSANVDLHGGTWNRLSGRRLSEVNFGLIGVGRIGSRVLEHLSGFGPPTIFANDDRANEIDIKEPALTWVDKDDIFENADVVSLHIPLTADTRHLVARDQLLRMKPDAILINTARGGIVNEPDLSDVLAGGHLGGAAIDVFEEEPYTGPLTAQPRALLTCHMGSMTSDCRAQMEIEATNEAVRFFTGLPLEGLVPASEYEVQARL